MTTTALITTLLPLLAQVESNNNDRAVGDHGRAIGRYQIHRAYYADAIKGTRIRWDYKRCGYDGDYSEMVVYDYLVKYAKRYERITGKPATLEVLARIHNGGPDGWKNPKTKPYARKVIAAGVKKL
jgi:hypothetical protein